MTKIKVRILKDGSREVIIKDNLFIDSRINYIMLNNKLGLNGRWSVRDNIFRIPLGDVTVGDNIRAIERMLLDYTDEKFEIDGEILETGSIECINRILGIDGKVIYKAKVYLYKELLLLREPDDDSYYALYKVNNGVYKASAYFIKDIEMKSSKK